MHDVVVGMWQPRAHETTAKLKASDFCTVSALLSAMKTLRANELIKVAANAAPKERMVYDAPADPWAKVKDVKAWGKALTNDCAPAKTDPVSLGCKTMTGSKVAQTDCTHLIENNTDMYATGGPNILVVSGKTCGAEDEMGAIYKPMGGTNNDGKTNMTDLKCWIACNADATCKYWAWYNTGENYKIGGVSKTGVKCMKVLMDDEKCIRTYTNSGVTAKRPAFRTTTSRKIYKRVYAACKPNSTQSGDLGSAYQKIYEAYGMKVAADPKVKYDFTCKDTPAWPTPGSADTTSKQKIFMQPDIASPYKCKFVAYRTGYSVF